MIDLKNNILLKNLDKFYKNDLTIPLNLNQINNNTVDFFEKIRTSNEIKNLKEFYEFLGVILVLNSPFLKNFLLVYPNELENFKNINIIISNDRHKTLNEKIILVDDPNIIIFTTTKKDSIILKFKNKEIINTLKGYIAHCINGTSSRNINDIIKRFLQIERLNIYVGKLITEKIYTTLKSFSLDYLLKFNKTFNNSSDAFKRRIFNREFEKELERKTTIDDEVKKDLINFEKGIIEQKIKKTNNEIKLLTIRESEKMQEIYKIIEKKEGYLNIIEGLRARDNKPLEISEKDIPKEITGIIVEDNRIYMSTDNIFLDLDEELIKRMSNDYSNVKKALKYSAGKNYKYCIGKHKIIINSDYSLEFKPLSGRFNYHIERYACYGTFTDTLIELMKNKNLKGLIKIAVRLLKNVTIGDVAGDRTINNCFIIDDKLNVKYDFTGVLSEYVGMNYLEAIAIKEGREKLI